jgi:hypothetical protein
MPFRHNWIRTFAQSPSTAVPANGVANLQASGPPIPIPAKSAVRVVISDVNIFSPDAVAANLKLTIQDMDLVASLLTAASTPINPIVTAAAVLATLGNTRNVVANGGNVEGVTAMQEREILIPSDITGTQGPPTQIIFTGDGDVTNSDAVAHNAIIAIDVLWSFEPYNA